jgi:hypothetical protein
VVKRQGREAGHSPPTCAGVKKKRIYTLTPLYAFIAMCLVKHRDSFTFLAAMVVVIVVEIRMRILLTFLLCHNLKCRVSIRRKKNVLKTKRR